MKSKKKISQRERWIATVAPTVLILGVYLLGFVGDLSANLDKQQRREQAAAAPLPPPAASPTLARAKQTLESAKRSVAEQETHVAEIEARIRALSTVEDAADREPAQVVGRVERIFARYGISPLVSEAAGEGDRSPSALASVLAPKSEGDAANGRGGRLWHYVFNDTTPRFQQAMHDVVEEVPTAVPLSLNLVYNPENYGETRLLELWLMY